MSQQQKQYDFSNRVVIITGASAGLGESMAKLFSTYGARLTITGRSVASLARVATECEQLSPIKGQKVNQVIGDLGQDETVVRTVIDSTIAHFGQLDVLINNAGGTKVCALGEVTEDRKTVDQLMESYDYTFRLNVRSVLQLTALAVPHLERTRGCIINISAVASYVPIGDPWFTYSMSKGALDMMTKNGAVSLGSKGIRVNSINPGPFKTSLHRDFVPQVPAEQMPEQFGKFGALTFLGRVGEPDEVAHMAAYLASDQATFITGSLFTIDGGCALKMPLNMH